MNTNRPLDNFSTDADADSPPAPERGGGGRSRPLGHGDLRLLLLALIEQQPRHGYELMRQIAALFKGLYTPSAGAIYPALAQLETDGWVQTALDDGRKRYQVTEAGRTHVAQQRDALDAALARTHRRARELIKAQTPAPIREAIHRIKHGLFARHGQWTEAETARIAALLNNAADGMERDDG
ncbi:PadR family transcriptional regulator [Xanthomonas hortorum pv. vitians]|uniref:PadR family transcriptional regulator n=1 Tax=Xanthomonas hortorum pv. vitians TaxID=83224 RepID=A0A6V7BB02_9XANT|nr:PadR family transcriptional regulator [Xanthomonas hortorum]APP86231.1 PadR family transcriptional regulator [Xanthomonas hortorum pv. gardneri]ASW47767.1 PadR family transcriptional regulator [Xanthomonas hortorum]MCC8492536.1 PadR family transcriptional regulator [Xanthomonas hortorum pv. gardneri]MCC8552850.1 PadR family transcriptional regulator [Xanthomonas hortorum pv. gardneri]MCE4279901.1 PadR family transcriptional regulator [Xanthomonas hortorum pv. vitians]